jgi:hypothetical protein
MYEGRTRGKKLKYTYSDDEDMFLDGLPSRRSTRNASSNVTPAEPSRPRFTASGRQIRSRAGGLYGEALLTGQREDSEFDEDEEDEGRPQRARTSINPNGYSGYRDDDLEAESEAAPSEAYDSGREWGGEEDDENEFEGDDEAENVSGDDTITNGEPQSLVVQLRYGKGNLPSQPKVAQDEPPPAQDAQMTDVGEVKPSLHESFPHQTISFATPAATAPSFSPAPVPQLPQPVPTMAAPSMPLASNPQKPAPQTSINLSTIPQTPTNPTHAPVDMQNSTQPAEASGLNGLPPMAESRPVQDVPHPQAPSTQSWNPAS